MKYYKPNYLFYFLQVVSGRIYELISSNSDIGHKITVLILLSIATSMGSNLLFHVKHKNNTYI